LPVQNILPNTDTTVDKSGVIVKLYDDPTTIWYTSTGSIQNIKISVNGTALIQDFSSISTDTYVFGIEDGKLLSVKNGMLIGVDRESSGTGANCSLTKHIEIIEGDNVLNEFIVEHNLDTENVQVQVRELSTKTNVLISDTVIDKDNIKITFASAPDIGEDYQVTIIGL